MLTHLVITLESQDDDEGFYDYSIVYRLDVINRGMRMTYIQLPGCPFKVASVLNMEQMRQFLTAERLFNMVVSHAGSTA